MRNSTFMPMLTAMIACTSCGGAPDENVPVGTGADAAAAVAAADSSAPAHDVSALNGCEIVRGEEVVRIAGATKLSLAPTAYPAGCMYVVEMAGGGGESY